MAPPKPYKPVAVTLPQPYSDPSFDAFRKELGDIASRKDRAALAGKVVPNSFFWMGEKGDKANKRKSGIDNLATAIGLDARDGEGWEILTAAANETTLEQIPDKQGRDVQPGRSDLRPEGGRASREGDRHDFAAGLGLPDQGRRSTCRRPARPARRSSRRSARSSSASCRKGRRRAPAATGLRRSRGRPSCGS